MQGLDILGSEYFTGFFRLGGHLKVRGCPFGFCQPPLEVTIPYVLVGFIFKVHFLEETHGSFSSSSVLSNVARFLDLPSNQSEQSLLVYNEMFLKGVGQNKSVM